MPPLDASALAMPGELSQNALQKPPPSEAMQRHSK